MGHSVVPHFNLELILDGRRLSEHDVMNKLSPRLRKKLHAQVTRALTFNNGAVWKRLEGAAEEIASVSLAKTSDGKVLLSAGGKWLEIKKLSKFAETEEEFLTTLDKVQKEVLKKGIGGSAKYKKVPENQVRSQAFRDTAKQMREVEKKDPYKFSGPIGDRVSKYMNPAAQGLAGLTDACAVGRNGLEIAGKTASTLVGVTGVVPGVALLGLGGIGLWQSWKAIKTSAENKDDEGGYLAAVKAAENVYLSAVGVLLGLCYAPNVGIHVAHVAEIGQALGVLGPILYGVIGLVGAYRFAVCQSFRNTMNHLLFQEGREKEIKQKGLFKTIQWLQSEVRLSPAEEAIIEKTVKPEKWARHKERALRRKWAKFERVADVEALEAVRASVESNLLMRLFQGEQKAVHEAKILVHKVSRANFDKLIKATLAVIIGILGIVAFVVGGHAGAALFIVAAVLFLLQGDVAKVHEKITRALTWHVRNQIWKESEIDVEKEEECLKTLQTSLPGSALNGDSQTTPLNPTGGTSQPSSDLETAPLVAS